jgi:hypothetical protein
MDWIQIKTTLFRRSSPDARYLVARKIEISPARSITKCGFTEPLWYQAQRFDSSVEKPTLKRGSAVRRDMFIAKIHLPTAKLRRSGMKRRLISLPLLRSLD